MKKSIDHIDKFVRIKALAESQGIEVFVSGDEIIIQKEHTLRRSKSIKDCFGFILGFIAGMDNKYLDSLKQN